MRFDIYLVEHKYFESRNKASSAVKAGCFTVNNRVITKPSYEITEGDAVVLIKNERSYVARSAEKLLCAYRTFHLDWTNKTAADFGASTGGFCQVLLENDLRKVYAIDIGTGQLHPCVKEDPRIVNMEHTNARYLSSEDFSEPIQVITADLSFISLTNILPAIYRTLTEDGEAVVLVKPQFEAGKSHLSKSGVVTSRKVHAEVLKSIIEFAASLGFGIKGVSFSGLAGESGNREYLLYLKKDSAHSISLENNIERAVYQEE